MSSELPTIEITTQPIELCKLLKIANFVSGGGEAKIVISEGYVLLNEEVVYQKRKKVYHNDIVEFNGEVIQVLCNNGSQIKKDLKNKTKKNTKTNKIKSNKEITDTHENVASVITTKRRPISF